MTLPRRRGTPVHYEGVRYKSAFEASVARHAAQHGIGFDYEGVLIAYVTHHVYRPDFVLPSGVLVEVKGYFPAADRAKLLAIRAAHPELDIRLVFQNPRTKIAKGRETSYGTWASVNGFTWAALTIPPEWAAAKNVRRDH